MSYQLFYLTIQYCQLSRRNKRDGVCRKKKLTVLKTNQVNFSLLRAISQLTVSQNFKKALVKKMQAMPALLSQINIYNWFMRYLTLLLGKPSLALGKSHLRAVSNAFIRIHGHLMDSSGGIDES